MAQGPTHLVVGLLKKPHGIKGDVLVYPMTDQPERVFHAGRPLVVLDKQGAPTGQRLVVRRAREYQRAWLVHFENVEDRRTLEGYRDIHLAIEVGEARPLAEGEFFLHELVGLSVQQADKTPVGTVADVIEAPQGFLLAVQSGTKEHLIPFKAGIIRRVDRDAKMVTVEPPAGLLEL